MLVGRGVSIYDILSIVGEEEVAGRAEWPVDAVEGVEAVVVCYRVTE